MKLFSIPCVTCGTSLSVREVAAIGKILNCPKCQSMVEVIAPDGWRAPTSALSPESSPRRSSSTTDTSQITGADLANSRKETTTQIDMIVKPSVRTTRSSSKEDSNGPSTSVPLDNSESTTSVAAAAETSKQSVAIYDQDTVDDIPAKGLSSPDANSHDLPPPIPTGGDEYGSLFTAPPKDVMSDVTSSNGDSAAISAKQWTSSAERSTTRWVTIAGVSLTALAALIAIWAYWGPFGEKISAKNDDQSNILADDAEIKEDANQDADQEKPDNEKVVSDPPAGNSSIGDPGAKDDLITDRIPTDHDSDADELANLDASDPMDDVESDHKDKEVVKDASQSGPIAGGDSTASQDNSNRKDEAAIDIEEDLFGLIDPSAFDQPSVVPKEEDDANNRSSQQNNDDPSKAAQIKRRAPIDVLSRLADPIRHIEYEQANLVRVLDLIAEISTIPITLDTEALEEVGIGPGTSVSVKERDTTVGKVLDKVLKSVRLKYVVQKGQLVVISDSEYSDKLIRATLAVPNLVIGDGQSLQQFADLITLLVEPDSWSALGGKGQIEVENGKLVIDQTKHVHAKVFMLLEKLRNARGLPLVSQRDAKKYELTTRYRRVAKTLGAKSKMNFSIPTPLSRIVRRLHDDTGLHFLVDWRSLSKIGIYRDTAARLIAGERTLGKALEEMLESVGASYRILNDATIEITSREVAESKIELEFYPVGDLIASGIGPDALTSAVAKEIGPARLVEDGGLGSVYFDSASKSFILSLTTGDHIKIDEKLTALRSALKKSKKKK